MFRHHIGRRSASQQVGPAGLAATGLTGQLDDQRRGATGQLAQRIGHLGQLAKAVEAAGPAAQLPWRLRPAQHQQRQHRPTTIGQLQHLVGHLTELLPSLSGAGIHPTNQRAISQGVERAGNLACVERHDRVAPRALVGGRHQRVERQRVGGGNGQLFLHQASQHPEFDGSERRRDLAGRRFAAHQVVAHVGDPASLAAVGSPPLPRNARARPHASAASSGRWLAPSGSWANAWSAPG